MFEGADYTIFEIIWWMAAAALLGFLIGWVLKRFFVNRRLTRELHAARNEVTRLRERLAEAEGDEDATDDGDESEDDDRGTELDESGEDVTEDPDTEAGEGSPDD